MRKLFVLIIALISTWQASFAQTDGEVRYSRFKVELNPAYYALGGYSIRGFYVAPKQWSYSLQFEAGFDIPDFARDAFFDDNEAIDVRWDFLVAFETRYRFNKENYDKGFYAQASIGYEGWTVEPVNGTGEDEFTNWFSSVGIGYTWYPFKKKRFHLGGTYNVIFILNNTDTRTVNEVEYNIQRVIPPSALPTSIYVGWRF
ncbi:MAG: hypothetical protein AAFX87_01490 [Bacteroidota bacterium]